MAIQDKPITIKGSLTTVSSLSLYPQADGTIVLVASGSTKDANGNNVTLLDARLQVVAGTVPVIDNLLARALTEVRKANGLEV